MFGQGGTRPGTHDVTVGDDLGDDQWHQIDIERNKQHVKIIIDITRKFLTAERLQRYQNITIAGLPLSIKSNTSVSLITPAALHYRQCPSLDPLSKVAWKMRLSITLIYSKPPKKNQKIYGSWASCGQNVLTMRNITQQLP